MERNFNLEEYKTVYSVISKIMEDNHLTKDTSFVRVKNYISQMICDYLTKKN